MTRREREKQLLALLGRDLNALLVEWQRATNKGVGTFPPAGSFSTQMISEILDAEFLPQTPQAFKTRPQSASSR